MRRLQQLPYYGIERWTAIPTVQLLVHELWGPRRAGSRLPARKGWVGAGDSSAQGEDVANALTRARGENLLRRQIRSPDRRTSVQPLVQPSHTNLHPFMPTPGHFRPSEENGRFAGMKKPLPPLFTGVSGLFRLPAKLVGDAGVGPATLTV